MKNITLIIPCFNEEFRFPKQEFSEFFKKSEGINFLFVNDGSADNTKVILDLLSEDENIQVIHLNENLGKAEAIRTGVLFALKNLDSEFIGYFDADLATPLEQLLLFQDAIGMPNRKVIYGSRIKRAGSTIDRNGFRHYSGRVIATIINIFILDIPVYDTQCGAKLISRSIAEDVFKEPFISRWLFDVEILGRLQNKYNQDELFSMVYEVPLTKWQEKGKTKIRVFDMLMIPIELMKIYRKY